MEVSRKTVETLVKTYLANNNHPDSMFIKCVTPSAHGEKELRNHEVGAAFLDMLKALNNDHSPVPGEYWYGVETLEQMDLTMLDRAFDVIQSAKQDAFKQVEELRAGGLEYGGIHPGIEASQNGPVLGRLYMRVFLRELRNRMEAYQRDAQHTLFTMERGLTRYNQSLDSMASRWTEYWPSTDSEATGYIKP